MRNGLASGQSPHSVDLSGKLAAPNGRYLERRFPFDRLVSSEAASSLAMQGYARKKNLRERVDIDSREWVVWDTFAVQTRRGFLIGQAFPRVSISMTSGPAVLRWNPATALTLPLFLPDFANHAQLAVN